MKRTISLPVSLSMLLILALSLFASVFILSPVAAQTVKIRDLPTNPAPSLSDYLVIDNAAGSTTYKITPNAYLTLRSITCTPPLLCGGSTSMNLGADRALSITGPNTKTRNVTCTGIAATDTANRDAAVVALQSSGGGILHISGTCVFNSSLVNNPISTVTSPLIIEGDGRNASTMTFTACTTDCIYLGAQGNIGSGRNDGSGLRHIRINPASGSNGVHLVSLQGFDFSDVYIQGGQDQLIVEESRFGNVRDSYFAQATGRAIRVIGENFSANWYTNLDIVSTLGSNGFEYSKTGTVDSGGIILQDVGVNGTWTGSGFLFNFTSQSNEFVFLHGVVADGNFSGDGIRIKNGIHVYLTDAHGVNQLGSGGGAGLGLDGVISASIIGGLYIGNTGASGSDISLKNSSSRIVIDKPRLEGSTVAIRVDGTTHNVDYQIAHFLAPTFCNDLTKLVSTYTHYRGGQMFVTGSGKSNLVGYLNVSGSSAHYSGDDSSGNFKIFANDGTTTLETLTQSGGATFAGAIAGSNLSGTNTGDQTITLTGDVGGTGTSGIPTILSSAFKGWTDAGATINTTTSTDKVGIGTASPNSLLSVSANAATLPTPMSGTLSQIGQVDATPNRFAMNSFGSNNSFDFMRADTTAASPSALVNNEVIGQIAGFGYDGSAYASSAAVSIQQQTAGAWTSSSHPTMLRFSTTPSGSTTIAEAFRIDSAGHLATLGAAPTVACTSTGTSPATPTIDSGGTDGKFKVTMSTGTGTPGSTGTCTITYANAYSTNNPTPVCFLVKGGSTWGNTATVQLTTESLSAPVLTWNNSVNGVATNLTVSTSYKISCITLQ